MRADSLNLLFLSKEVYRASLVPLPDGSALIYYADHKRVYRRTADGKTVGLLIASQDDPARDNVIAIWGQVLNDKGKPQGEPVLLETLDGIVYTAGNMLISLKQPKSSSTLPFVFIQTRAARIIGGGSAVTTMLEPVLPVYGASLHYDASIYSGSTERFCFHERLSGSLRRSTSKNLWFPLRRRSVRARRLMDSPMVMDSYPFRLTAIR